MYSRRKFIWNSSIATASIIIPQNLIAMEKSQWGLQLYSLKDEFSKGSVDAVIEKVANIGYAFVEPYGYNQTNGFWGLTPGQFKTILNRYGLKAPSAHYDFGTWEQNQDQKILEEYIRVAGILGHEYITIPYINREIFATEETLNRFVDKLNRAGKFIKENGFKLVYHNHDFEFGKIGNKVAYEMLLERTDKQFIDFEIDLFWAARADQDIKGLFKKHPDRFPMWHIKDMDKSDATKNTEIGNGTIDYGDLLKEKKVSGLKYAIVEQENFDIDPFESIKRSINYLKI